MPEAQLQLNGVSSHPNLKVKVEVDQIRSEGGPDYPRLVLPLVFALRAPEEQGWLKPFTLLWVRSQLSAGNVLIGEGIAGPMSHYTYVYLSDHHISIHVPLDVYRIERIESKRRGDIELSVLGSTSIAQHPKVQLTGRNDNVQYDQSVTGFSEGSFMLNCRVPQSHWISNVLPGLGYGTVHLVEVPIPERIVPDSLTAALTNLDQANQYFVQADYAKVLSHCRIAAESALSSRQLTFPEGTSPSFPARVDAFINQHLATVMPEKSTQDYLKALAKATWTLCSKPQHPPAPPHSFTRADAETVILTTTALVSYIGKLLKQAEGSV